MPIPLEATSGELAQALGTSERVVAGKRQAGRLPVTAGGRIDLRAILKAGVQALGEQAGGGGDGQSLDAARIRLVTAQAEAREMLNAQMRGETVLAEDLEAVVGAVCEGVRAKVLAIPTRAAAMVLGLGTLAEVRDKLTELTHDACSDLASGEIVSTVHDRARRRAGRGAGGDAAVPADGAAAAADGEPVG